MSNAMKRWKTDPRAWDDRIGLLLHHVSENSDIMDLGCGLMTMENLLPVGCKYHPVDFIKRDERTIIADLNANQYPYVKTDYIICSGLIEYVKDVPKLFKELAKLSDRIHFSYAIKRTGESARSRKKVNGWLNSYSEKQIKTIVQKSGFRVAKVGDWCNQKLFYLRKNN